MTEYVATERPSGRREYVKAASIEDAASKLSTVAGADQMLRVTGLPRMSGIFQGLPGRSAGHLPARYSMPSARTGISESCR
jgi:hypothetical protein